MSDKVRADAIQKDWKDREMIEVVHLNILKITKFLNEFDASLRYKLSTLAERLTTLERHLEWCETSLKHKVDPQRPSTKPSAPASALEMLPPPDRI